MSDLQESLNLLVKMDRQRRRWRFIVFALVLVAGVLLFGNIKKSEFNMPKAYVAQVNIDGMILDDQDLHDLLDEIAAEEKIKALVVSIDSPGGTMVGGLNLFHALRRVGEKKPLVTVMGTTAASAGYLIALAGDHMLANEASLTGSIGVFMPLVDATDLASKVGIQANDVASGSMKTATSPLHKRDEAATAHLQKVVDDLEDIFLSYVRSRRPIDAHTIATIADGRVLIGRMAADMNLVDELGGLPEARIWLEKERKIPQDMEMISIDLGRSSPWLQELMSKTLPLKMQLGMLKEGAWSLYRP